MKNILALFYLVSLTAVAQKANRSELIIPPKQVVQIDYPLYQGFNIKILNQSKYVIGVSARDKQTDSVSKSFGLNKGSTTLFEVNKGMYLQFENRFLAPIKVAYILQKGTTGAKKKHKILNPSTRFLSGKQFSTKLTLENPWSDESQPNPFFSKRGRFT